MLNEKEVVEELRATFGDRVSDQVPFPKPYCKDKSKVRAIYLGCDPSNKHSRQLPYVFALESGLPIFSKFIQDHTTNLDAVGLSWESVYAQNLCQNYFENETSKNPIWKQAAAWWIPRLRQELDPFGNNIPVLLTSSYLYNVLVIGEKHKPIEYYECRQLIPIPRERNFLEKPLIPFYRNRLKVDYHLSNERWKSYKASIIEHQRRLAGLNKEKHYAV